MSNLVKVTPEAIKAMEEATGHSLYGGSSLPRIVACPASVGMTLRAGLKPESIYARQGSELHKWMEKAIRSSDAYKYLLAQNDITVENTAYLMDALDYVGTIVDLHRNGYDGYDIHTEVEGHLESFGLPEVYGTADLVIKSPGRIDVIDYKFGHGVAVYAADNYQLVSYLAMVVDFYELNSPEYSVSDNKMFVHICQPTKQIFDSWEVSRDTLFKMILGDVTDAIMESKKDNPRFGPSNKACQFCNANMICSHRQDWVKQQAMTIHQMSLDPRRASVQQWASFLDGYEALSQAAKNVEEFAINELLAGREFPGYKIVASKSNRKFTDEDLGAAMIKDALGEAKAYQPRKLVTLAQAETLCPRLKKDPEWKGLIYTPQGAPKLARITDPGKAIGSSAGAVFQNLLESELK